MLVYFILTAFKTYVIFETPFRFPRSWKLYPTSLPPPGASSKFGIRKFLRLLVAWAGLNLESQKLHPKKVANSFFFSYYHFSYSYYFLFFLILSSVRKVWTVWSFPRRIRETEEVEKTHLKASSNCTATCTFPQFLPSCCHPHPGKRPQSCHDFLPSCTESISVIRTADLRFQPVVQILGILSQHSFSPAQAPTLSPSFMALGTSASPFRHIALGQAIRLVCPLKKNPVLFGFFDILFWSMKYTFFFW